MVQKTKSLAIERLQGIRLLGLIYSILEADFYVVAIPAASHILMYAPSPRHPRRLELSHDNCSKF